MSQKILVIEDDPTTADFICKGLTGQGFLVDHVADGRDGLFHATDGSYGAIVLDRMLPGMDGMAVLAAMRAAHIATPVIILSSLGAVDARVEGLTSGADDYLTKPFAFRELVARLQALSRRRALAITPELSRVADLEVDHGSRAVRRAGHTINLTAKEFALLELLLRHQDQVVNRSTITAHVWDNNHDPFANVLDVLVRRLRSKIDDGFEPKLIRTVRGTGYRFGHSP